MHTVNDSPGIGLCYALLSINTLQNTVSSNTSYHNCLPSSHSMMCTLYCENEETLNTEGRTCIVSLYILCGVVVILDDCTHTMMGIVN